MCVVCGLETREGSTVADRAGKGKQQQNELEAQGRKQKATQQIRQSRDQKTKQLIGQGNGTEVAIVEGVRLICGMPANKFSPC